VVRKRSTGERVTKHKSRADRKSRRQRAFRANERGLPAAPSETLGTQRPQQTKRSVRARSQARPKRSAWLSVLVGAVLALTAVFFIAQSRKASVMTRLPQPAASPQSTASGPPDLQHSLRSGVSEPESVDSQIDNDEVGLDAETAHPLDPASSAVPSLSAVPSSSAVPSHPARATQVQKPRPSSPLPATAPSAPSTAPPSAPPAPAP